ncbi:MAG TPA: cation transporter, partial [Acidimicrobiia bacterium]|nr:cation transporter [Acidimicrobiia bacterium]
MVDRSLPVAPPGAPTAGGTASDPAPDALRPTVERDRLAARARLLAWAGNAWHLVEFGVAVGAGAAASSTALIGFGVDSLIEVLASSVIIWRFGRRRRESAAAERRAQQLVAVSFFVLAG